MEGKIDRYREAFRVLRESPVMKKMSRAFMIVCCVLPIAAILLLPRMGVTLGRGAWLIILLFCPVSHIFMMRFMHGRDHAESGCHEDETYKKSPPHGTSLKRVSQATDSHE